MVPDQETLRAAWKAFVDDQEDNYRHVRPTILESWKRCRQAKVNPFQKYVYKTQNQELLEEKKRKNCDWLEIARPVMTTLYRLVAGSGFIVTVSDTEGILLEILGDQEVIDDIARGNFVPGASWSEENAGTNGVGTALVVGQPLQIFSYEHYCVCSHRSTCSAAPIHGIDGTIVGVLNMTGSYEKVHPHTLGMVVAGADAITRQMASEKAWLERNVANRFRDAVMESISEGILATDRSHTIIQMNHAAADLLFTKPELTIGKDVREVLQGGGEDWESIVTGEKFITDLEQDIVTPFGIAKISVTSRPVRAQDGQNEGTVLLLTAMNRVRKLAQRMSGAVARFSFENMIGEDPGFKDCLIQAKSAARSDATVLLLGESGTGKDILAQAIHNESLRSSGPFVAINCGAIPRDLIGSELFGYTEGAFTGAKKGGSPGKFELADGGTIFLDEIGDMPPEQQATLLRVLEHKSITRIGGYKVLPINVRIIAATNRDLGLEVKRGNFRQDLYYRLNVFSIRLMPLRERKEDIELLFKHFLERFCAQTGKPVTYIAPGLWPLIKAYDWPGNIRELQNAVERALHYLIDSSLGTEHLPEEVQKVGSILKCNVNSNKAELVNVENEKVTIIKLLHENGGNISYTAKKLGIARTTLYRRLVKYGLHRNKSFMTDYDT
ncbi:transcriptional activator of acetoin/glycerol metabolism [Desulfoscipio gibsoniae DSM 7213]|uniref:Transcriptional activator of acetoin/glycerol metabolism n=1 Tax=Desulfoscipio gibsoniae DSM 7213 TaxID=767817 RepID=R4KKG3_9FIRM|nr:transcriptional activator of acetoin/glycerol metabolism [Desulfoscipio gibsoniae DSM 7213]